MRVTYWLRRFYSVDASDTSIWLGLVLTGLAILIMSSCAPYGGMTSARFGASAASSPSPAPSTAPSSTPAPAVAYFPGGPPPPRATISLRLGGVLVYPPAWLPEDDRAALGAAIEEYLRDAETTLAWKLPLYQFGRPLVLVLHDDQARSFPEYDSGLRLALLQWPAGPSGLPVAVAIVPELEAVLALEHQIDAGRGARGPSAEETALAVRGRMLPVRIATAFPSLYQR